MKLIPCILPLCLTLAAHAADPVVKLAGIQTVFEDGSELFDGFKTFNSDQGCDVTLIVHGGGRQIVAFDQDKAAIQIGGNAAKCRFFGGDSAFSKDHHAVRLEFSAEGKSKLAADGSLKVTGSIPVTYATGKEETRSAAFAVKPGAAVTFPADKAAQLPTLKVKSSGKPQYGDAAFELTLTTNRKASEFAGIVFHGKDGKAIEADRTSTSWMGFGAKGSGEITYSFKAAQTDLIIAVENWTGREDVAIKVDLSATLAGPKP